MKKKKITDIKEIESKIKELKIEMLRQSQKKKNIKKEIARLLTSKNQITKQGENK